jgi:hypothetical protein
MIILQEQRVAIVAHFITALLVAFFLLLPLSPLYLLSKRDGFRDASTTAITCISTNILFTCGFAGMLSLCTRGKVVEIALASAAYVSNPHDQLKVMEF